MSRDSRRAPRVTPREVRSVFAGRDDPCEHAQVYAAWVDDLLTYLREELTRSRLYIAQKQLQDKYFEMRTVVPPIHRDLVTDTDHRCIWHVYRDAYQQLKEYEIRHLDPVLDDLNRKRSSYISLGDVIGGEKPDGHST